MYEQEILDSRNQRDSRDPRDARDLRDARDVRSSSRLDRAMETSRDMYNKQEPMVDTREPRDLRNPRELRDPRESRSLSRIDRAIETSRENIFKQELESRDPRESRSSSRIDRAIETSRENIYKQDMSPRDSRDLRNSCRMDRAIETSRDNIYKQELDPRDPRDSRSSSRMERTTENSRDNIYKQDMDSRDQRDSRSSSRMDRAIETRDMYGQEAVEIRSQRDPRDLGERRPSSRMDRMIENSRPPSSVSTSIECKEGQQIIISSGSYNVTVIPVGVEYPRNRLYPSQNMDHFVAHHHLAHHQYGHHSPEYFHREPYARPMHPNIQAIHRDSISRQLHPSQSNLCAITQRGPVINNYCHDPIKNYSGLQQQNHNKNYLEVQTNHQRKSFSEIHPNHVQQPNHIKQYVEMHTNQMKNYSEMHSNHVPQPNHIKHYQEMSPNQIKNLHEMHPNHVKSYAEMHSNHVRNFAELQKRNIERIVRSPGPAESKKQQTNIGVEQHGFEEFDQPPKPVTPTHIPNRIPQATQTTQPNVDSKGIIPMSVFLHNKTCFILEIEDTASATCETICQAMINCDELGMNRAMASQVFTLWMISPILELQLKPEHKPFEIRLKWMELVNKYSRATDVKKEDDEPKLVFQRNLFYPKNLEEKIRCPKIIELLYEESKYNILSGRYLCEIPHYIMLGGIQAREELGAYNPQIHSTTYFREEQSNFLPYHIRKNSTWSWFPMSSKTSAEVRLLEQFKRIPASATNRKLMKKYVEFCWSLPMYGKNSTWSWFPMSSKTSAEVRLMEQFKRIPASATNRKLMKKYVEFCWSLPMYGSAFFEGQIEEPTTGLSSYLTKEDTLVLVAINYRGICIMDDTKAQVVLGLKYEEFSWEFAKPSREDNPDCLPCLFIQFLVYENGARVSKILQIFSKQAFLMDTLINAFVNPGSPNKNDETDSNKFEGHSSNENDPHGAGTSANSNPYIEYSVLSNKIDRLSLATFDEDGHCIGSMGSWSFS